jgi:hypothetical protein
MGGNLAEVCLTTLQLMLAAGLCLTVVLPGMRLGYCLCILVLRIWNGLLAALMGVLILAMVALAVITCLGVLNLPVAAGMAGLLALAALVMLLLTMLVHHTACCLKEACESAKAGVWHSPRGYKGPVPLLAWVMAAFSAVLLACMALCAFDATRTMVSGSYHAAFDALYETVPTAARTMVRSLRTSLEPALQVAPMQLGVQALAALRFAAVAMLYRDYKRLHR